MKLESGVLVINAAPKDEYHVSGSLYFDVDGQRMVLSTEVLCNLAGVTPEVYSTLSVVISAWIEEVGRRLSRHEFTGSPRALEL